MFDFIEERLHSFINKDIRCPNLKAVIIGDSAPRGGLSLKSKVIAWRFGGFISFIKVTIDPYIWQEL